MASVGLAFHGPINHPATTKLRNALCFAALGGNTNNQKPQHIYLLISSPGGSLEDGFSLFNLLRALGPEIVTVNMGQVASIANVIFLAGDKRYACEHSYFHFHDFDWTFPSPHTMTRENFTDTTQLLEIARTNKKALFKARTKFTDTDFESLKFLDEPVIKDAGFAKEKGMIHEIGMPDLTGVPILNVDY